MFAILTLVAFMMTLVPALAFAADEASAADAVLPTVGTIVISEDGQYTVTSTPLVSEGNKIYATTKTAAAETYEVAADAEVVTVAQAKTNYVALPKDKTIPAAGLKNIAAGKVLTAEAIKAAQDKAVADAKKADADAANAAAVAGASDIYAVKESVDVKDNAKVAILLKNAELKEATTVAAGKTLIIWAERTADTVSDVDTFIVGAGSAVSALTKGYYKVDPALANSTDILLTSSVSGKVTVKAAIVEGEWNNPTTPDEIKGDVGTKIGSANVEFTPLSQSANKIETDVKATVNKVEAKAVQDANEKTKDVYVGNNTGEEGALVTTKANSMDKYTVTVTVKAGDNALANQKVYISANKTGVDLEKTEATTDSRGRVTFDVSATRSAAVTGPYVINISSGSADDVTVKLSFAAVDAVNIAMVKSPEAPVAVDSTATFKVKATDVYGNNAGGAVVTGKVKLGDKETTVNKNAKNDGNGNIVFEYTPSKVGTYTATFQLENGKKATTTFEVAEQGKITEMQLNYDADTVNLGAQTEAPEVVQIDAAGVTKTLKSTGSIDFAIQGKGVKELATDGSVTILTDDKYAGEKLTVTAVDRNKGISAVATLTIAADAQSLAFTGSTAVVGSATNIPFSVVDANGNKVALGKDAVLTVSAVVTDKVDGSNTTATVNKLDDLQTTGVALLEVSSNKEGDAKVQVMVKSETLDDDKTVVKYYTGVANVTFGEKAATGANSTATMIMGSTTFVANGKVVTSDVAPFVKDGRTFLPIRALGEALGAEVAFDEATNVVTIKLDGKTVTMTLGSAVMTVGDKVVTMDTAAYATAEGRTVVPVRFAAEALGFNVEAVYATDGTTSAVNFSK